MWIIWIEILVFVILFFMLFFTARHLRDRLFSLWQEVSRLELTFHKQLFETWQTFQKNEHKLKPHEAHQPIKDIAFQVSTKFRHLELKDRQSLFKALQDVYSHIYRLDDIALRPLQSQFETLQNCRLKYNSKVLLYNKKINTFPNKFLAKRMQFHEKEYFG